jgi:formylglycine-generating enzyme required for sulfatase activity
MKRYLTIALMLVCTLLIWAQIINVSSFKLLETDLTANNAETMVCEQNGEVAALINEVTTQTGVETSISQTSNSQYVVFQLTPPNAIVELDGEVLTTIDGIAKKLMKFGTYNYRVQAPDFLSETGSVTVDNPNNKHVVNISLKPNFVSVTLTVDNDAEIWVNGERKGTGSWQGRLGVGTYDFETRKQNHRPQIITRDIEVSFEPQTIHLQAPMPIFGEADINSSPAMADIYIDGIKVGQTPQVIEQLLIGQHKLSINRHGYEDYSATFDVKEGETTKLSASLEKIHAEQVAIENSPTDKPVANAVSNSTSSNNDRKDITVGNVSFTMIHVDGGMFMMGATGEQGTDSYPHEKPDHLVTLSPYYIGETEVTQALWETVMGNNPSNFKGSNKPVEQVSWNDCQEFIRKLNQKTGLNFRLPTEAEWEYAARGGNKSKGYKYSGGNNSEEVARKQTMYTHGTRNVKTKKANELGLYDMSGNVDEWCQDWYGKYSDEPQTDPTGPSTGKYRVYRGGSYFANVRSFRVSSRSNNKPSYLFNTIGLRLVLQ